MADAPAEDNATRRGLVAGLRDTWGRLPRNRRIAVIAAGVLVLGAMAYLAMSGGGEGSEWKAVARGMSPEDLDAAVKGLDEKKIPYKLGDEGSILVAPDKIHDARLELALQTMPSGKSVGFEVFDEGGMGKSSFAEKVNYHRALEGELARTIRHLEGIKGARVHLVMPERRVFQAMDVAPSASVVLTVAPGFALTPKQAQAIRTLVAGAVERLAPGQVSIVDQYGTMLARPDSGAGVTGQGFEQELEQEQQIERRVVELLEPVVGPGKVKAQVALQMDFSQVVETREDFDPDQSVVRSEREQTETNGPGGTAAAGAPGTATNLPNGQGPRGAPGGNNAHEKSDTTKNYEIDKTTTRVEKPMPRVTKMSVAVLVDQDGKGKPRTKEDLDRYTRLVSHAVGIDEKRGDQIEVVSVGFAPSEPGDGTGAGPGEGSPEDKTTGPNLVTLIVGGVAGLLVLGVLIALFVGGKKKAPTQLPALATSTEVVEPIEVPPVAPSQDEVTAERRAKITELRDRAVALGNEDIHRLTMVFERWFDDERAREDSKSDGASKEAA